MEGFPSLTRNLITREIWSQPSPSSLSIHWLSLWFCYQEDKKGVKYSCSARSLSKVNSWEMSELLLVGYYWERAECHFVDYFSNFDDLWGWWGVSAHKNFPLRYLAGSLTFRVSFFRKISLIGTSPSEQDKNVNNIGSFQNLLETRRCRFAEYCAIFQNRKFPHQHNGCVMGILKQLAALIYFHFPTN